MLTAHAMVYLDWMRVSVDFTFDRTTVWAIWAYTVCVLHTHSQTEIVREL